jgi:cytoskeletal protein CcmA (bactofilin family)
MIWRREDAEDAQGGGRDRHQETGGRAMADQQGGEVTIVGQGAKLEGTVVSAGSLRIDGQVKGQVNADGDVMLSPQGIVEADIRAQNVSIAGRFKGSIVVKGRAEIMRGGRVDGNVTSKTLVVEEGAVFQGQSIMDQGSGNAPAADGQAQGAASTAPKADAPRDVKV